MSNDAVSDTYLSATIQIIKTLDVLSIPYMLVGSLAAPFRVSIAQPTTLIL